ncbi:Hypothetical predicted protein [Mytilus galloprovincialis]|uniref:Uncharacterized protein n=1 Tax=Mytilus galloprovincialis TaxID=29158 RepID=A0A8B6D5C6_MYTGA|nr:Hypothetical predicted protein [Mytilus galloprovincialis]
MKPKITFQGKPYSGTHNESVAGQTKIHLEKECCSRDGERRVQVARSGEASKEQNKKLSPEKYYLLRTKKAYEVNITAQSSIEVDGETVEENENGSSISVEGSPIVAQLNTGNEILVDVDELQRQYKITSGGNECFSKEFQAWKMNQKKKANNDYLCLALVAVVCCFPFGLCATYYADSAFQVKVVAIDEANTIIIRTVPSVIKPTSVELTITSYKEDIALDKENEVSYTVVNTGTNKEMYNIRLNDDKSFALEPLIHYHTLNAGDQANGSFILFRKTTLEYCKTYQLMAELNSTLELRQTVTKRVSVTKTERPVCEVVSVMGKCEIPSLNTANCSKYNWYAESYLYFRDTHIESISSSGGSAIHLEYQNLTNITEGPLRINISGVCCTPYVTIDATDVDGFMSHCILDLSDGLEVEPVDPVEDVVTIPSPPTNTNKSYVVIGAVSGCVIFLCIVILIGVITKTYFGRKDKKKKYCITSRNGLQNKPIRNVQNISFSFHNRLEKFKDYDNDSYSQCY